MKKLMLAALLVAASGVFLYLQYGNEFNLNDTVSKETKLKGIWKIAVQTPVSDTFSQKYQYEFGEKGLLIRSIDNSIQKDTALYVFSPGNRLSWQFSSHDSNLYIYKIQLLTHDSLVLQTPDSVRKIILLKKAGLEVK